MNRVIGECSICGGDVSVPHIWHGIFPPKPTCSRCGAQARSGPVIDMRPVSNRGNREPHQWTGEGIPYSPPFYQPFYY